MTLLDERATAMSSDVPRGAVELRPLACDTAFFGARMGVIARLGAPATTDALYQGLVRVLTQARAQSYAHLIFRAASDDFAAIWAAERAGLRLVDIGVDSTTLLTGQVPRVLHGLTIRPARDSDLPVLRATAAEAFTLSRFSADPFFSEEQVREFHRTWATNLYHGLAKVVLICERDGDIAGFVSCTADGDEGRIPLIATAAGFRGQGIGRALVGAALRWFVDNGCRVAHVKTQAHNVMALALYHRSGFNVSKTELTFSVALSSAVHSHQEVSS